LQELLKRHACSEADSVSASKHEGPVRRDALDGTAVAGGLRSLVLIRLSACMFSHRFTKTTAGVSRYLPPGHSECGFTASVSLCRPKGSANLVGMLNMSHITRRYHGSPHRTGQCSQWSGVHVCLRKRACSISQQSTVMDPSFSQCSSEWVRSQIRTLYPQYDLILIRDLSGSHGTLRARSTHFGGTRRHSG